MSARYVVGSPAARGATVEAASSAMVPSGPQLKVRTLPNTRYPMIAPMAA